MISFFKNLYLNKRFFIALGAIATLFMISFSVEFLFTITQILLVFFIITLMLDGLIIFNNRLRLTCIRTLPRIMSLGNENETSITIKNISNLSLFLSVINELPFQLQDRDIRIDFKLKAKEEKTLIRPIRPTSRGEYKFGKVNAYVRSGISLLERRIAFPVDRVVPVYPSLIDVRKYELQAASYSLNTLGLKKMRRLGHSYEFEQVSQYTVGDDFQSINWKATSKMGELMINKYTDERAQPVYALIDKSRYMKMPFNGLSLLDYSINASLIILNTALKKSDRAGLMTFSDQLETFIKADNKRNQLNQILERLYRESETKIEANYELLYVNILKRISGRSLLLFFTNFESTYALDRVLPVLRKLNRMHLLVVVVFENSELESYFMRTAKTTLEIFNHTIANKYADQKRQVISTLRQYGIQLIYTKPEDLSINTLNKYLELKSRGMI